MINCYKTFPESGTRLISEPKAGCWVDVVSPTQPEKDWLVRELEVVPEFVQAAGDDEERSRVDYDDDTGQALVILDCPFVEDATESEDMSIVQYDTHPLSVFFLPRQDMVVTVSMRKNETVELFAGGKIKGLNTNQRARFMLRILLRIAQRYIVCLRSIDRQFRVNENILRKTMRNTELVKMLGFEKSLVYFSASLQSLEAMLTRISSGRYIKLYDDDRDLLDDVFIEIRQAMEMCSIYTNIIDGTTETYSSVINNNLNFTMRFLTIVTLVLSIPTVVFSFYGMNVNLPFSQLTVGQVWFMPVIIAIVSVSIVVLFFRKSHLFK